ncbi:MAG: polysaccharide deacetylase family protein [Acetobacteraceae bacterium]|nr:polysaccharide deacetylase family protein [Acetobacteraceae bacterium]
MRSAQILPAGWPEGRTLAVSVSVMLEGWTDKAAPGVGPMGNVLKPGVLDLQGRSWAEYGAKEGAWRLLDVLAAAETRAVFYVSGILAERNPDLMREIVAAGHVVAAHGWGQEIIPATQTEDEERADLTRCIRTLEASSGQRPRGWLSPRCTPSAHTAELLAEAGMRWHCEYFDEDLPRIVTTAKGDIVGVPFTMEVNDMPHAVRYGNDPSDYPGILSNILDGWPTLGTRAACLDVTVHAHVYGRPYGALAFRQALRLLKGRQDFVHITDHDALAGLYSA